MKQVVPPILLAATLWFVMFSRQLSWTQEIHDHFFWQAMVCSTLVLSVLTLVLQRKKLAALFHFEPKFLAIGAGHAVLLYGLSRLGVWLMSLMFSWTVPHIQAVYATRVQLDPHIIAPLLFFIIAPCEETFWRGFVQARLEELSNPRTALLSTTALYALVHIWALNPMLLVAALVLGMHWGFLFRRYHSLVPGIISHALWDTTIFVLLPVQFS